VPGHRRNYTAGCGFFFERLQDVQQGDGFRKNSTHPAALLAQVFVEVVADRAAASIKARIELWNGTLSTLREMRAA
jgi:hypothetical protein